MVESLVGRVARTASALLEMKKSLHPWDEVDNKIDKKLNEINEMQRNGAISLEAVEQLEKDRDQFYRLTSKELNRNINNIAGIVEVLKPTAILGLAVPTAVLAFYAAPLILEAAGSALLGTGLLIAGGAVLNGAVGGAANAIGQAAHSLIAWDWNWSSDDWLEMTLDHMKWGAIAASVPSAVKGITSVAWRQHPWALGIPSGLAILSSAAVIHHGSKNQSGTMEDVPDILPDDPQSPESYLALAQIFNQSEGIDFFESAALYRQMQTSGNPEIEWAYTQFVSQSFEKVWKQAGNFSELPIPAWVTLYKKGTSRQNFCLNFSQSKQSLPCEAGFGAFFPQSGVQEKEVMPNFRMEFHDGGLHEEYARQLMDLKIHSRFLTPEEGIPLIAQHIGNVSLVSYLLPKIYERLVLPEAVCVVTNVLLNIFLTSDEINSDLKTFYTQLLKRSTFQYSLSFMESVEILKPNLATVPTRPQKMDDVVLVEIRSYGKPEEVEQLLQKIREEGDSLQKLWEYYHDWAKQHWVPEIYSQEEKSFKDLPVTLRQIYSDWPEINYKLFQKRDPSCPKPASGCLTRYEKAAEEGYSAMNREYLQRSHGIYDLWQEGSGIDGGFSGWILSDFALRSEGSLETAFWKNAASKGIWVVSGYLVFRNLKALVESSKTPLPVEINLPQLTGFIPQGSLESEPNYQDE